MQKRLDIEYRNEGCEAHRLDVFLPEQSNRRLLFFIHGGGWTAGNKEQWHSVMEHFCELGYVCVSVRYRLAPQYPFPAQWDDVRLAFDFVKAQSGAWDFDLSKIAVWGSSAGGHLAAMLANENQPAAAVGLCPVFSILPDARINIAESVEALLGGTPAENLELARAASPIERITKNTAPFLIVVGDADDVTPLQHQEAMRAKLEENGVPVEAVVLPGVDHGFGYGVASDAQKTTLACAERFLEEWL